MLDNAIERLSLSNATAADLEAAAKKSACRYARMPQSAALICANDIASSRSYIEGIAIQNQTKGRICGLIPIDERLILQADCGGILLLKITPAA